VDTPIARPPASWPARRRGRLSSDQRAFKNVSWGKAMMWIFLLSDTFIFGCFLLSYMTARMSTPSPWPNPSEVFALTIGGQGRPADPDRDHDLRADQQQRHDGDGGQFRLPPRRRKTAALMLLTALLGATFVGMQAFEWTKLIAEGVRPWENPWGAAQFGSAFFMITGFHGTHVTIGVIFLLIVAVQGLARRFRRSGAAFSPAARATTRPSRSWASTGTSSTWSGSSSSRSSISGEEAAMSQPS
jgi:cytochrome c oxidase subunit 3